MFSKMQVRLYLLVLLVFLIVAALIALFVWDGFKAFNSPQKTVTVETTHQLVLEETQRLGKLELTKFIYKDVVEHSKSSAAYLPTAKVVLIVSGEAVGCIDLMRLKENDITTQGDSVFILLPPAQLCYHKIDHQKSRVYHTEFIQITGETKLVAEAFQKAETAIEKAALENGILAETTHNAEQILKPILEKMTGKKVFFQQRLEKTETLRPKL